MTKRLALSLASVLLLTACTGTYLSTVAQSVPSFDARAQDPYVSVRKLSGAQAELWCPTSDGAQLKWLWTGKTDDKGHVGVELDDPISIECEVRVVKEGYLTRTVPVRGLCVWPRQTDANPECEVVHILAELLPLAKQ